MSQALIIGSGAGGGTLAWALTAAGFDVLVLEKGRAYERSELHHDEVEMSRRDMFVPPVSEDPHILVRHGEPDNPVRTSLGWTASCVGGGTMHMGGCYYRFHEDDFRLRSRYGAFEEIADWPYGYAEIEPYYCKAEHLVGVSGAGNGSPYEAFRSQALPMPPLQRNVLGNAVERGCHQLGLTPFVTPRAINSVDYDGRPPCAQCHLCAGFGCHTGARGSVPEVFLNRAAATGRCTVVPQAMVSRITTDNRGRATGCVWFDAEGIEQQSSADLVAVCCSAVESARLLLLSSSPAFPSGLANRNGLVGKHLQFHGVSNGKATFRRGGSHGYPIDDPRPLLGVSVADHYFINDGALGYPKGGILRFDLSRLHPVGVARRLARDGSGAVVWGERFKRRLTEYLFEAREVEFEVFQDFIPNDDTCVELDPVTRDRWGLPVARMTIREPAHHAQAGRYVVQQGLDILAAAGADECINVRSGGTSTAMVHGTCRAAATNAHGVVNPFCQSFDVPNLFVVDGSFMPTSGGAPSTLTIIANALRVADYITNRARTGAF